MSGARNDDDCNVTTNKFNEIKDIFPNGKRAILKLCDTWSNGRYSMIDFFVVWSEEKYNTIRWDVVVSNSNVACFHTKLFDYANDLKIITM